MVKKIKKQPNYRYNKFQDTHEFEKVSSALTVIVKDNLHIGYVPPKAKQVSEVMLHVPLLTDGQMENILDDTFVNEKDRMHIEFALVQVIHLKMIFSLSGKVQLNDFNKKIKLISSGTYILNYFPGLVNDRTGRIIIVPDNLFDQIKQESGKEIISTKHFGSGEELMMMTTFNDNQKSSHLEGILVSSWEILQNEFTCNIGSGFVNVLHKCYYNGYGSRLTSYCWGINLYIGTKRSYRGKPTPLNGKSSINNISYCRSNWRFPQFQLYVTQVAKVFRKVTSTLAKMHDLFIWEFFRPNNADMPCDTIIVTSGRIDDVIGFTNEVHLDMGDKFRNTISREMMKHLEQQRKMCDEDTFDVEGSSMNNYNYVHRFNKRFGMGTSTSIIHEHVISHETILKEGTFKLIQFLI